ncbi:ABC transporter substrate-binding protein [Priestia megaterium]|uniref:ABC transporter substrate-binding protein n=1 Tax=Priestia megaterium TaxID=1404 RepID=UPI002E1AA1CE|nr:ABC transporter substrate-binding protein [Priestia megaterium]MED4255776.1 ABC transporter substrate-binding protein [Priestia megaterium]MED4262518.1 ABC transporter substrate-binding protein [Priestia megaterium]MED4274198.1 ABC transporter substrate-binding protein [Priestia megaterium]MED4313674.1 ABC transporter substrate-binding protein [Priestia megaterium]
MKRTYLLFISLLTIVLMVAGCSGNASKNSSSEKEGGTLNVASQSEPATLDAQITGDSDVKDATRSIYEGLMILDEKGNPKPDLASKVDISDDKKTYTFQLRKGVKFHNGKEMTADDVVASINRWIKLSSLGKTNFSGAEMTKTNDDTVELHLPSPNVNTLSLLADPIPAAAILPKEVVDNASDEGIKDYIGTGPYKVKEWKKNQYLLLEKFKDYSSKGREVKKTPHVDEIKISFVSDESTRISGITTGQFDVALSVASDNAKQVEGSQNAKVKTSLGGFMGLFYNADKGVFKDINARKAVNAALNSKDILDSSYGSSDYYKLSSSIVNKEYPNYYSTAGKEEYNQHDKKKAKEYLKKSGYNGEEIRLMASRDYQDQYNTAVVVQQELKDIGMNVKLEVYDWATFSDKMSDTNQWDIYPVDWNARSTIFQGFWTTKGTSVEKSMDYLNKIKAAPSVKEARGDIDAIQQYVWDELPFTLIGHKVNINAVSNNAKGYEYNLGPIFYNMSLTK